MREAIGASRPEVEDAGADEGSGVRRPLYALLPQLGQCGVAATKSCWIEHFSNDFTDLLHVLDACIGP